MIINTKQTKLINDKLSYEISINSYQKQIDELKLSKKEINKLKKKIAKQEKKLKELENMIWKYDVGDIVLFKKDLREVKITKLVNIKVKDNRFIYYGDFKKGKINVAFSQDELIKKPFFNDEYIELLQEKIGELENIINQRNFE